MTTPAPSQALVRVDPQTLLTKAIEGNASIETLERLVSLAKDVKAEQARAAWFEAMSEFQSACPDIRKTSQAEIYTQRGSYRYKYAELPDIMAAVKPLMRTLGLSVFWATKVEPGKVIANCRVAHVLGHVEESGEVAMPVPDASERGGGNPLQRVGSALSYARRYSLMAILGIAPEDDDDGRSGGQAPPPKPKETPQTPPQPAPAPMQETTYTMGDNSTVSAGPEAPAPSALDKAWVTVEELQIALEWSNTQLRDHCAAEYKVKRRQEMNAAQVESLIDYMRKVLAKRQG